MLVDGHGLVIDSIDDDQASGNSLAGEAGISRRGRHAYFAAGGPGPEHWAGLGEAVNGVEVGKHFPSLEGESDRYPEQLKRRLAATTGPWLT